MVKCDKCDYTIKYRDKFCRSCGEELAEVIAEDIILKDESLIDQNAIDEDTKLEKPKTPETKIILLLILTISLFILAVVLKNIFFTNKETHGINDNMYIAAEGENIYYTNMNVLSPLSSIAPKTSTYKITGNKAEKIFDGIAIFPNVKNKWMYYTDSQGIYKIKTDGTEKQTLLSSGIMSLKVDGKFIYYMSYKDNIFSNELNRMNLDGTNITKISSGVLFFQVVGSSIYYSSSDELGAVYKTNLDGSHKTKLCTIDGVIRYVKDGYIYYRGQEGKTISRGFDNNSSTSEIELQKKMDFLYSDGYLCRTKIDGSGKEILIKQNTNIFNIVFYNNFIIYQDSIKNFYKLDLNGKNEVLILDQNLDNLQISVINNYMYYYDTKENKLYKRSLNGKEVTTFDLTNK